MTDLQPNLFGDVEAPRSDAPRSDAPHHSASRTTASLFAEVVFDRPLDHAYTYAVPDELREAVAVGKRVLVPFGRGDRATVGFCVATTR